MSDSSIAFYRKYRPETWDAVRGQDHVVKILNAAIKGKSIGHAYLFTGSRGTGKTSVARIFAREAGVSGNDIYEMDAASNRGIDEVRALRDAVQTLPLESPYKVYILDEAHMLTKEAFNALLKTLEEPPKHVIFILATTELEKMPETIVSRCEVHTFKKPTHAILRDMVMETADAEGAKVESAAADLIAILGDGSFRDTHGTLQKAISFAGKKELTRDMVEEVMGAPSGALVTKMIEALAARDAASAHSAIDTPLADKIDMAVYAKLIMQAIRHVLLLRNAPAMRDRVAAETTPEELTYREKLAKEKTITSETLLAFLDAYQSIPRAHLPQIPLEVAVIRLLGEK
ncbi:MAG: DNA polymerase III subunit gamma/tau [Patescibacteria group bacterium]